LCVAATYFNGLVGFRGRESAWRGPDDEHRRHSLRGTAVALDPGCTFAASGNMTGEVQLWRCQDGVMELDLALHEGEVTALTFSPNGTLLFTTVTDRFIYGISTDGKNIVYATVAPLPPIALLAERDDLLFALDSGGSIYTFGVNTRSTFGINTRSRPAPVRKQNGWRSAFKKLFRQK